MDSKQWFRDAQFGMMIHWGLYSLLAGEYRGKRMRDIGEWIQSEFQIPNSEYHQLTKAFNPLYFNAEEWVKTAIDAGVHYMVLTAKHHEGFALFKSEVSDFNVVDSTPFGRDIVAELAEACYKYNMKFGLYYSQEIDWSESDGGGYTRTELNCGHMSWTNDWDYPDNSVKNFERCFYNKTIPQVTELLKNYGDLCLIWFDTPHTITPKHSKELYDLVKRYQPNCLVNSRIGNNLGDYKSANDNEILSFNAGNNLFESPITLNDTWGFKYYDDNWKSPEKLLDIKNKLNKNGINCLLNVGPDYLGRIPAPCIDILQALGRNGGIK